MVLEARPGQLLCTHLIQVSVLSSIFGSKISVAEIARIAGLFHDIGKKTEQFQKKLAENTKDGEVQHSNLGAKYIYDKTKECLPIAELIANVILGHHGTLYDYISPDGATELINKLDKADSVTINDLQIDPKVNLDKLYSELVSILSTTTNKPFAVSMIVKYLYSCLIDADRLDAYLFENNQEYIPKTTNWDLLDNCFNEYMLAKQAKSMDTDISRIRQNISNQCARAGEKQKGIYKLEVPTGGGKTLSSLRFALTHAKKHSMDRIIYIIPYLSIINQTADEFKNIFDPLEDIVLEHHSDILPDEPEYYKLQTNRWDSPIIVTTLVQFLESIFSSKAKSLRKFHNMANSVIIFDEAQSIPIKCIHLFNSAVNFLNESCKSTILLCTATQPLLDDTQRPLKLSQKSSIAGEAGLFEPLKKRTEIINKILPKGYEPEGLANFVIEKFNNSTLVILNTKKAVRDLYNALKQYDKPVVHLSTNMCSAHRNKVIEYVRKRLKSKQPIICVSSQLIEAGVDISFECVIRDIAGLDSIYQAAGRCNRHGEYDEIKPVYIINVANQNLNKLPDIKIGAEITRRLFNEGNLDIDRFYKYYFYERTGEMDYKIKDGTIYDLLATNRQGFYAYEQSGNIAKVNLRHAIKSAADEFFVIAPGQTDVIVPYGESSEFLERYSKTDDLSEKRKILRKLGKFTVSLYEHQLKELSHVIRETEGLFVLSPGFYDEEIGVNVEGKHEYLNV